MENSMILVKSTWQETQTFKMVPILDTCPYVECIFDPTSKVFVIIGKTVKTALHMLPKLDEYGKAISGNRGAKQERRSIETFQEYYIEDVDSIKEIVNIFAVNAKKFSLKSFLETKKDKPSISAVVESQYEQDPLGNGL